MAMDGGGYIIGNMDAEQGLLGCLLHDNRLLDRVTDFLRAEHFHVPAHARIFTAMLDMVNAGKRADVTTLWRHCAEHMDDFNNVGGPRRYLADLLAEVVWPGNATTYAEIVAEAGKRRLLDQRLAELRSNGQLDQTAKADALLAIAEAGIEDLANKQVAALDVSAREAAKLAVMRIDLASSGYTGIPSGIPSLDSIVGSFEPGELIVVGARPSVGKTVFGMTVAMNQARRGIPTGFLSLEMTAQQLGHRFIAGDTGIATRDQRTGKVPMGARRDIDEAVDLLPDSLRIHDKAGITAAEAVSAIRRLKARHGIQLAVIDYLGLIRSTDPNVQKVHQIEAITQSLKQATKDLEMPIILLCQLRRLGLDQEDRRPTLSDLRDSGAIEQDADTVILLHRPECGLKKPKPGAPPADFADYEADKAALKGQAEAIVAKCRQGETGTAEMFFDGPRQVFR